MPRRPPPSQRPPVREHCQSDPSPELPPPYLPSVDQRDENAWLKRLEAISRASKADPSRLLLSLIHILPLSTDAQRVRELILQAFADHEDVLDTPAPNVFLDGIEGGNLVFNAKGLSLIHI